MTCPSCGGTNTRRSNKTKFVDLCRPLRGRQARRCRDCRTRFYSRKTSPTAPVPAIPEKKKHHQRFRMTKATRRRAAELLLFGIMLALFYVFLSYIAQEHTPGGSEGASVVSPASFYS